MEESEQEPRPDRIDTRGMSETEIRRNILALLTPEQRRRYEDYVDGWNAQFRQYNNRTFRGL